MSNNKGKPMQQVNFEIDHIKEAFYSNDFGIIKSPNEIVLDFRQTLPRLDVLPDSKTVNSLAVKHNPIIIQPKTMKMLLILIKENVEDFEKKWGEIKLPEKWRVETKEKVTVTRSEKPAYIG